MVDHWQNKVPGKRNIEKLREFHGNWKVDAAFAFSTARFFFENIRGKLPNDSYTEEDLEAADAPESHILASSFVGIYQKRLITEFLAQKDFSIYEDYLTHPRRIISMVKLCCEFMASEMKNLDWIHFERDEKKDLVKVAHAASLPASPFGAHLRLNATMRTAAESEKIYATTLCLLQGAHTDAEEWGGLLLQATDHWVEEQQENVSVLTSLKTKHTISTLPPRDDRVGGSAARESGAKSSREHWEQSGEWHSTAVEEDPWSKARRTDGQK